MLPATEFSKTFGGVLVKAAAHGISQGTLAMMQNDGAGFLSGAAGGFFGSLGATAWGGAGVEWKGIGGKYAGSSVGTIAFGALSGGVGAELSGGNFWKGAIAGGIVDGLNDVMHKQQDTNMQLAKKIAREKGYDWREVKALLDENPFTRTHEGVSFMGYEATSSKYGGSNVSRLVDSGAKKGTSMVLGQALKKIIGKGAGQLLSSTAINEPDDSNARLQRFEECKQRLIDHVFTKPLEYQTPSMYNNMQSWKSHSSIYDRIMNRYY